MKHAATTKKSASQSTSVAHPDTAVGSQGLALTPPSYGMEVADRQSNREMDDQLLDPAHISLAVQPNLHSGPVVQRVSKYNPLYQLGRHTPIAISKAGKAGKQQRERKRLQASISNQNYNPIGDFQMKPVLHRHTMDSDRLKMNLDDDQPENHIESLADNRQQQSQQPNNNSDQEPQQQSDIIDNVDSGNPGLQQEALAAPGTMSDEEYQALYNEFLPPEGAILPLDDAILYTIMGNLYWRGYTLDKAKAFIVNIQNNLKLAAQAKSFRKEDAEVIAKIFLFATNSTSVYKIFVAPSIKKPDVNVEILEQNYSEERGSGVLKKAQILGDNKTNTWYQINRIKDVDIRVYISTNPIHALDVFKEIGSFIKNRRASAKIAGPSEILMRRESIVVYIERDNKQTFKELMGLLNTIQQEHKDYFLNEYQAMAKHAEYNKIPLVGVSYADDPQSLHSEFEDKTKNQLEALKMSYSDYEGDYSPTIGPYHNGPQKHHTEPLTHSSMRASLLWAALLAVELPAQNDIEGWKETAQAYIDQVATRFGQSGIKPSDPGKINLNDWHIEAYMPKLPPSKQAESDITP